MIVRFEPSGTHVHHGYLKVRLDVFPDLSDKTYVLHHVLMPVFPPEGYPGEVDEFGEPKDIEDYNKWLDGLPTAWQLNPMLMHFLKVDADITRADLETFIAAVFDASTLSELDNALSADDTIEDVKRIMKTKSGTGKPVDNVDIIAINARLLGVSRRLARGN